MQPGLDAIVGGSLTSGSLAPMPSLELRHSLYAHPTRTESARARGGSRVAPTPLASIPVGWACHELGCAMMMHPNSRRREGCARKSGVVSVSCDVRVMMIDVVCRV